MATWLRRTRRPVRSGIATVSAADRRVARMSRTPVWGAAALATLSGLALAAGLHLDAVFSSRVLELGRNEVLLEPFSSAGGSRRACLAAIEIPATHADRETSWRQRVEIPRWWRRGAPPAWASRPCPDPN